ncbi:putative DNA-binding protein (MmcQ/YjbR family) [Rhodovulum iodosum]|uniref:DNA-binding protein (MmcQ/YjbR family) n=1 Tax=Rhodovulum iodosum TaxID=68291 RepID=A0ABV3XV87_9RHOB|nr:MmcQ/YjbR family DNA-binding protein [Rhodovulum robiginosum]RSK33569.1 MmcQ/YjbR family DNA-binding protein [Rhodovulum robiginosum]
MTEDDLIAFCDARKGATREQPFGPQTDVWKIGGKIFAMMAHGSDRVSLKCADAEIADMLVSTGRAGKAPYLPRGGWIAVPVSTTDETELKERLMASYEAVLHSLPRKVRDGLR